MASEYDVLGSIIQSLILYLMKKFYLLFEEHHPLSNGWVEVEADDGKTALEIVRAIFGLHWDSLVDEDTFNTVKGKLLSGKYGNTLTT